MRNTIAKSVIVGFFATAFCGCHGGLSMPRWDWWRSADNEPPTAASNLAGSPYNSGIPSATASYPGANSDSTATARLAAGSGYPSPDSNSGYPGNSYSTGRGAGGPANPGLGASGYPARTTTDSSPYPEAQSSPYPTSPSPSYPNTSPSNSPYPMTPDYSSSTPGSGERYPSTSQDRYPGTAVSYPNPNSTPATTGTLPQFPPQSGPYGGSYGGQSEAGSTGSDAYAPNTSTTTVPVPYTGMQITTPDRSGSSVGAVKVINNAIDNRVNNDSSGLPGGANGLPGGTTADVGLLGPRYSAPSVASQPQTTAPDNNAYIPGASTYQPGKTGHNFANVPEYTVPSYQSPMGTAASTPERMSPYLPGSTSTYTPTTSVPINSPATSAPAATYPAYVPAAGTGVAAPPAGNQVPAPSYPSTPAYPPAEYYPSTSY